MSPARSLRLLRASVLALALVFMLPPAWAAPDPAEFRLTPELLRKFEAVDAEGKETTDPNKVVALLPFGQHKGYGLSLINELVAGLIGGSLPTIRSRPELAQPGEKTAPNFFFQVIHPDAVNCGAFAKGRNQQSNLKAVIEDILGHGNEKCMLPGQIEHNAAVRSQKNNGLVFTEAEIAEFKHLAQEAGVSFDGTGLKEAV